MIPALFIGLGGTGQHIGLLLKKQFYEQTPEDNDWDQSIKFLFFDTNGATRDVNYEKPDKTQVRVPLPASELIGSYGFNADEFLEQGLNRMIPGVPPRVFENFATGRNYGLVHSGAGMMRQLGRLCFFRVAHKMHTAIERLSHELHTVDVGAPDGPDGAEADGDNQRVQVFIVCSTAGGTGSSCFLDVAYVVHQVFGANASIHMLLFGPEALDYTWQTPAAQPALFSNAYATLRELEYFHWHPFSAEYPFTHLPEREVNLGADPFMYYFISRFTTSGRSIGVTYNQQAEATALALHLGITRGKGFPTAGENFGMLADFSWRLGTNGRSCRYATFGLTELMIPRKEVAGAREGRYMEEFAKRLRGQLHNDAARQTITAHARQLINNWGIDEYQGDQDGNPLLNRLLALDTAQLRQPSVYISGVEPRLDNPQLWTDVTGIRGMIDTSLQNLIAGEADPLKSGGEPGLASMAISAEAVKADLAGKLMRALTDNTASTALVPADSDADITGSSTALPAFLVQRTLAEHLMTELRSLVSGMQGEISRLQSTRGDEERSRNLAEGNLEHLIDEYNNPHFYERILPFLMRPKPADAQPEVHSVINHHFNYAIASAEISRRQAAIQIYQHLIEICDNVSNEISKSINGLERLAEGAIQSSQSSMQSAAASEGFFQFNVVRELGFAKKLSSVEKEDVKHAIHKLYSITDDKSLLQLALDKQLTEQLKSIAKNQAYDDAAGLSINTMFIRDGGNDEIQRRAHSLLANRFYKHVSPWWYIRPSWVDLKPPVAFYWAVAPQSLTDELGNCLRQSAGVNVANVEPVPLQGDDDKVMVFGLYGIAPLHSIEYVSTYSRHFYATCQQHRNDQLNINAETVFFVFGTEVTRNTCDIEIQEQTPMGNIEHAFMWGLALNIITADDNDYFYSLLNSDIRALGWESDDEIRRQADLVNQYVTSGRTDQIGATRTGPDNSEILPEVLMSPQVRAAQLAGNNPAELSRQLQLRTLVHVQNEQYQQLLNGRHNLFEPRFASWLLELGEAVQAAGGTGAIQELFAASYQRLRSTVLREMLLEFVQRNYSISLRLPGAFSAGS